MTLDIWYLKMIPIEFKLSMPTDFTSVVIQLTCRSAPGNHSLVHGRFTVLHAVHEETEFFNAGLFPVAHRATQIDTTHTQTAIPNVLEEAVILDHCHPTEHSVVMNSLHFQYSSY